MATLVIAANGRHWLTFETGDAPEWQQALAWLRRERFIESGAPIIGPEEGLLPSFVRQGVTVAVGFDQWVGPYLLAECEEGDRVIGQLAGFVGADDLRPGHRPTST